MSELFQKPLVIIGGGGHSSVLVDILLSQKRIILAVISPEKLDARRVFKNLEHLREDNDVFKFDVEKVLLVNGVGVLPNSHLKQRLNRYYSSHGYQFETVVADSAEVSPYAEIQAGVQVLPKAVVQAGAKIASHTILNSGSIIEHDCEVGEYNHIAPSSTLCGQVKTANGVYIGAGATVIQNISLAENSVVGAGATLTKDLMENEVCYSNRAMIKHKK